VGYNSAADIYPSPPMFEAPAQWEPVRISGWNMA